MEPSEKTIQDIKNILEKEQDREFSWEEARKAACDMQNFARIILDITLEEVKRKKLLDESPEGFHLDTTGTCQICCRTVSKEKSWYDKYGIKCMICQTAIDSKIIPAAITKSKESWYSKYDLETYFNIKGTLLNKLIKQSILKDRIIADENNKRHLQLFLIKDNKDILPSKRLLKGRITKIVKDDEEYFTQQSWYEFADLKLINRLKKYTIIYYLEEAFSQPIKGGRFLFKGLNPLFSYKS
jgi:hypothetical protein